MPLTPDGGSWAEIEVDIADIGACSEDTLKFALGAMSVFRDMALPGWQGPVSRAMSELGGKVSTANVVTSSTDPPGLHDRRTDGAGRTWATDADGVFWMMPTPSAPWYRADTYQAPAGQHV